MNTDKLQELSLENMRLKDEVKALKEKLHMSLLESALRKSLYKSDLTDEYEMPDEAELRYFISEMNKAGWSFVRDEVATK
ncbi:hypothetical protein [Swingsia samuiensis]|uniref:Uncharacterized protein n=1 Tax=Swingsia samuiensis TaxID=1293412 RepID=A0A4Y6UM23_9PROT|nr:hypothetical protein [Swingsia samuiensis]QDH17446.1 hypothetical protein E3D00_07620 [Swingsia samuiensis]